MAGGKRPAGSSEKDYQRRLGQAIIELREVAEMSQAVLAEAINRSEAAVSRWETGKATPTAFDLVEMARTFGLPDDALSVLIRPPETAISPVRQMLSDRAAAGARRGQGQPGHERGAA
jgi:transcriptional regulator with XRE-family HTH domain